MKIKHLTVIMIIVVIIVGVIAIFISGTFNSKDAQNFSDQSFSDQSIKDILFAQKPETLTIDMESINSDQDNNSVSMSDTCWLAFEDQYIYSKYDPEWGPDAISDIHLRICSYAYMQITFIDSDSKIHEKINRVIAKSSTSSYFYEQPSYEEIRKMDTLICIPFVGLNSIEYCSKKMFSTKIERHMGGRDATINYDFLNFNLHTGNLLTLDSLFSENKKSLLEEYVQAYCKRHKISKIDFDLEKYERIYNSRQHDQTLLDYKTGLDWQRFLLTEYGLLLFQKVFDMNPALGIIPIRGLPPIINDTVRIGEAYMPVIIPYDSIEQFLSIEIN